MGTRRDQVLEAAIPVLVEDGTHGLTHRKVDRRAEVPAGTTSNHFPNRLALLRGILDVVTKADREFVSRPVEYDGVTEARGRATPGCAAGWSTCSVPDGCTA